MAQGRSRLILSQHPLQVPFLILMAPLPNQLPSTCLKRQWRVTQSLRSYSHMGDL